MTYTTVWRPAPTQKPKALLIIFSVSNDALSVQWKRHDKRARCRRFSDSTMWRPERIRCQLTLQFKTCSHRIGWMMIRQSKLRILNSSIRFQWWLRQRNRRYSMTLWCGHLFDAFCHSCLIKYDRRLRISNANCMATNTTTCRGISAPSWRTTGWDLVSKRFVKILS